MGGDKATAAIWPGQVPPSDEYFLEAKETPPVLRDVATGGKTDPSLQDSVKQTMCMQ